MRSHHDVRIGTNLQHSHHAKHNNGTLLSLVDDENNKNNSRLASLKSYLMKYEQELKKHDDLLTDDMALIYRVGWRKIA